MNKEEIVNEVMGSFKMTVDTKGIKKLEEYIDNIEQQNKKYKEVIDKTIEIAYEYAQIDGAHHKTWVIDQMIRELLGTEYDNFIKEYEEDGEYTWDIGIAP